MPPDDLELEPSRRDRLVEDHVRHAELAQIMEQASAADVDDVHVGETQLTGDASANLATRCECEPVNGLFASTMSAKARAGRRRRRRTAVNRRRVRGASSVRADRRVEFVEQVTVGQAQQRIDDVRVIPGTPAFGEDLDASARPRRGNEDVETWTGRQDPGQRVDVGAAQAPRLTAAVPVLVDVVNRAGDRIPEARLACDAGPPLATDLFELPAPVALDGEADRSPAQPHREGLGHRHRGCARAA